MFYLLFGWEQDVEDIWLRLNKDKIEVMMVSLGEQLEDKDNGCITHLKSVT